MQYIYLQLSRYFLFSKISTSQSSYIISLLQSILMYFYLMQNIKNFILNTTHFSPSLVSQYAYVINIFFGVHKRTEFVCFYVEVLQVLLMSEISKHFFQLLQIRTKVLTFILQQLQLTLQFCQSCEQIKHSWIDVGDPVVLQFRGNHILYSNTIINHFNYLLLYSLQQITKLRTLQNLRIMLFVWLIFGYLILLTNSIYDVPSYFGHFSRIFFNVDKIRQGKFKIFQYHHAVDMNSQNSTIYFANTQMNCIEKFDLVKKSKIAYAGTCGTSGNRVGGISIMLLNGPTSVVSYQFNQQSSNEQANMSILITANKQCEISSANCQLSDTQAWATNLTINNLRPSVRVTQFPAITSGQKQYLYVSDTNNHCIKMIDMTLQSSMVVAGECGVSGFTDGPIGYNRLNKPTALGITRTGTLYFFDSGNQYMRKLEPNGQISTLLNGACKYYGVSRKVAGYSFKNIICYDNWVQLETKAKFQHTINKEDINVCTQHSSIC